MKATAMNGECRPVAFGAYTKVAETFERALAIETFPKVVDSGWAFGYSGNHRQAVTDGFISRYGRHSAQSLGRVDLQTIHSWRLARSLTFHKTSCYQGDNGFERTAEFRADDSEPARRNAGCARFDSESSQGIQAEQRNGPLDRVERQ